MQHLIEFFGRTHLVLLHFPIALALSAALVELWRAWVMKGKGTRTERLAALTSAMVQRQEEGTPVHEWSLADIEDSGGWKKLFPGQQISDPTYQVSDHLPLWVQLKQSRDPTRVTILISLLCRLSRKTS